ncbi:hypothetical protein BCR34DRAFT_523108 [Clohesyomyces aquaticus]|uniref:Uncharacterized protein n=1 Tax=Clohesyomyces aquaticus TaxID=1231657 RepID=A0A1Y1YPX4_9PLEO|nr:hypothetical protein BCR34DRAFT_523108 [Clohesyomyces aquaticus]
MPDARFAPCSNRQWPPVGSSILCTVLLKSSSLAITLVLLQLGQPRRNFTRTRHTISVWMSFLCLLKRQIARLWNFRQSISIPLTLATRPLPLFPSGEFPSAQERTQAVPKRNRSTVLLSCLT